MMGMVFIAYDVVMIPIVLAWGAAAQENKGMAWTTLLFWTLDSILGFRSAYYDRVGNLVTSPIKVRAVSIYSVAQRRNPCPRRDNSSRQTCLKAATFASISMIPRCYALLEEFRKSWTCLDAPRPPGTDELAALRPTTQNAPNARKHHTKGTTHGKTPSKVH